MYAIIPYLNKSLNILPNKNEGNLNQINLVSNILTNTLSKWNPYTLQLML